MADEWLGTDTGQSVSPKWRNGLLVVAGPAVGVAFGLWLTSGAWGPHRPAGGDTMGHLVRVQYGLRLWEHGQLDGWLPRFNLGAQEFLVYGPGFTLLVGLARLATLGFLSDAGALKVVQVGAVVALAPAGWYLARSFFLDRRAATVAGVLVLGVDSIFGVGPHSTFGLGFVPNQAAAPFWCVAVGALWRLAARGGRPPLTRGEIVRTGLMAAAALALLLLIHPISVLVLATVAVPVIVVLGVSGQFSFRGIAAAGAAAAVAAAVDAFWVIPVAVHRTLTGGVTGFPIDSWSRQLGQVVRGKLLFGPVLGWMAVGAVGLTVLVLTLRRGDVAGVSAVSLRGPVAAMWLAGGLLALAHLAKFVAPGSQPGLELGDRALGYVGILAVLPLAWWLVEVPRQAAALAGRLVSRAAAASIPLFEWRGVAVLVAVLVVAASYRWQPQGHQAPLPRPEFVAATAAVRRLPVHARVAVDRPPNEEETTGVQQPNLWVAEMAGRDVLNVIAAELSASSSVGSGRTKSTALIPRPCQAAWPVWA